MRMRINLTSNILDVDLTDGNHYLTELMTFYHNAHTTDVISARNRMHLLPIRNLAHITASSSVVAHADNGTNGCRRTWGGFFRGAV